MSDSDSDDTDRYHPQLIQGLRRLQGLYPTRQVLSTALGLIMEAHEMAVVESDEDEDQDDEEEGEDEVRSDEELEDAAAEDEGIDDNSGEEAAEAVEEAAAEDDEEANAQEAPEPVNSTAGTAESVNPTEPATEPENDGPTTSHRAQQLQQQQQGEDNVINLDSPSPPKKRKRLSEIAGKVTGTPVARESMIDDDEDNGMTCPICLESWEMSGEHRLVSLKCGHLFGESCIRRWLIESQRQSAVKVCPQCKTKASGRDIRCLYAKRLRAIDRTEEHDMRRELDAERRRCQSLTTELATVKMAHSLTNSKLKSLQLDYERLRQVVRAGGSGRGCFDEDGELKRVINPLTLASHRLYMEKNFEITREPGCRVLLYSAAHSTLIASQKSAQNLFPGFGVRFIDPLSFKPLHFMHTSAQMVRDMAFSESQHLLTLASRDVRLKTFDIRSRLCAAAFSANDKQVWACGFDRNEREHFLYAGDLRGGVCVFDVRFPETILSEFQADDNFSPVINIAAVPAGKVFPNGGFLVCQLSVVKFYEYINETAVATRLNVDGPFLSMQYDPVQETVLFSVRSNAQYPKSRFILGQLDKIDSTPVLQVKATIFGSPATPVMTRATQLGMGENTLVVGYLQDNKQLMMYDVRREERVQTMPVNEIVYDICPVTTSTGTYLAGLTDNKCRIYKINSSTKN
ncbi:E3 ubiquitin-protein ligase RFWD3 [Drosophila albomicans]|uniref:RING-type E3 ubiquitin transferase n=1 Tax=Drosophila albomicans TaxID=7291 RepID=A0A6P8XC73_DROAB|nr:E3 ubiquitin-protein ligase RFWD3 [Drosophila albomicans]